MDPAADENDPIAESATRLQAELEKAYADPQRADEAARVAASLREYLVKTNADIQEVAASASKLFASIDRLERIVDMLPTEGYTPRVTQLKREIAKRWGESSEDILLKALTLYRAALEAEEAGHHLAILSSDDEIIRDVTEVKPGQTSAPAGA